VKKLLLSVWTPIPIQNIKESFFKFRLKNSKIPEGTLMIRFKKITGI